MHRSLPRGEEKSAQALLRFELGFDEESYQWLANTRLRNPELFVFVRAVQLEGGKRSKIKIAKDFINLGRSVAYRTDAIMAERIVEAAAELGSRNYDCYQFACDVMGVVGDGPYLSGWQFMTDEGASQMECGKYAVRMSPLFGEEPDNSRDHWYVPLAPTDNNVIIHVVGNERPLAVSGMDIVREIYPGKISTLAIPGKLAA